MYFSGNILCYFLVVLVNLRVVPFRIFNEGLVQIMVIPKSQMSENTKMVKNAPLSG